jgi:mannose-6-phosphate isomerase-like protein (cupin superfamily)
MRGEVVNLAAKADAVPALWTPCIVEQVNDLHVKVVRLQGEFVWHAHPETDELFIVLEGSMRIERRDGAVTLRAGELYVVPRGVEHRPVAEAECRALVLEPAGTVNTGDAGGDLTADPGRWI